MHRRLAFRRPIGLLLLVLQAGGCSRWQVQTGTTPAELIARDHPKQLHLTLFDGTHVEIRDPQVDRDSVRGRITSASGTHAGAIATSDVALASTRQLDGRKTSVVVVGVVIPVAVAVLIVIAISRINWNWNSNWDCHGCLSGF
ncbi:MAG: hypothetical protein ACHQQ3_01425 [Gemmatimonadales bacterium]